MQGHLYLTEPADRVELRPRIKHEFAVEPQDMINSAIGAYEHRLRRCIEVEGKSVEQNYA
jgi:hypothetical protein